VAWPRSRRLNGGSAPACASPLTRTFGLLASRHPGLSVLGSCWHRLPRHFAAYIAPARIASVSLARGVRVAACASARCCAAHALAVRARRCLLHRRHRISAGVRRVFYRRKRDKDDRISELARGGAWRSALSAALRSASRRHITSAHLYQNIAPAAAAAWRRRYLAVARQRSPT